MDDGALRRALAGLAQDGPAGFDALYEQLSVPVFTVILRITQDRVLAEDVLQEFFLKLYRSPPGPGVKRLRAYLFQSARNLALDALRREPRHAGLEECGDLPQPDPGDPAERLDLERALAALPLTDRQLVTLHINGGLKFRELAELCGMPLGTVLWRYRRAIGTLKTLLDGGTL